MFPCCVRSFGGPRVGGAHRNATTPIDAYQTPNEPIGLTTTLLVVDEGHPISYKLLARGTVVWSADDREIGTVEEVLVTDREDIFDGIVIRTGAARRFVDAPEVARIAERRVTLSITHAEAATLPEPARGAPEFKADPAAGRWSRFFGGGWKRR
jgi:hypothetical protein